MAYTTINKSTDYFNTKLYTGNGSTQSITGVGFQPDFTWLKSRSNTYWHWWTDAVRGVTKNIYSNGSEAEQTNSNGYTAFGTDGFTLGNNTDINNNNSTYASWNWKANGTGAANTDGSINSTVSVNATSGFSIVKWTGNGGTASVGHGLGVKPNIVIKKNLSAATNWIFSTTIIDGSNDFLYLNSTDAKGNSGETAPTASLINLYANSENNGNGNGMIAYCFAEKQGYSKFGSYVGNGNADGSFIYTGFKPAFIMVKRTDSTSNWQINDNKRDVDNVQNTPLMANLSNAESTDTSWDSLSNGFKMRQDYGSKNASGGTYIYMAFAEAPLVGSNNVPATAR